MAVTAEYSIELKMSMIYIGGVGLMSVALAVGRQLFHISPALAFRSCLALARHKVPRRRIDDCLLFFNLYSSIN